MMSIKKSALISASIISLYNASLSYANGEDLLGFENPVTVSRGIVTSTGDIVDPSIKDPHLKQNLIEQDEAAALQADYNNSWTKSAKDTGASAVKYAGNQLWDWTKSSATWVAAWNLNYYAFNLVEEGTAWAVGGVGTLTAGPAAGACAYHVTKGGLKVARYIIPGFEGFVAGAVAPITKAVIIEPTIKYGPTVVKGVSQAAVYTGSAVYNNAVKYGPKVAKSTASAAVYTGNALYNGAVSASGYASMALSSLYSYLSK